LQDTRTDAPKIKSDAGESKRGAKTKLTKREINNKLAQVPVFYAVKNGVIFTKDGSGYLFAEKVRS
jgi:hypothetical protein